MERDETARKWMQRVRKGKKEKVKETKR